MSDRPSGVEMKRLLGREPSGPTASSPAAADSAACRRRSPINCDRSSFASCRASAAGPADQFLP